MKTVFLILMLSVIILKVLSSLVIVIERNNLD